MIDLRDYSLSTRKVYAYLTVNEVSPHLVVKVQNYTSAIHNKYDYNQEETVLSSLPTLLKRQVIMDIRVQLFFV